jgi:hypothetical protein
VSSSAVAPASKGEHADSFQTSLDEEEQLRKAGVILDYKLPEDKFPPNNRTLENFFRGAWTYHIHNQVSCNENEILSQILVPITIPNETLS